MTTPDLAAPAPPPIILKRHVRAADYRERALESVARAEASVLDRVRERHEAAAARWRELAALSERVAPTPSQPLRRGARTTSAIQGDEDLPCIA